MARVTDLLNSLGVAEDGISTSYPETFVTDIQAAYEDDLSIPDARIAVLEADLAAAQAEILALKAHNYELITMAPVPADESDEGNEEESEDSDDNDDNSGVESLFGTKED